MSMKTSIRIVALAAAAWMVGPACASQATDGTDSNTHWVICSTVLDCPNANAYACIGGRCVATSSKDSGAPNTNGFCPPNVGPNVPCGAGDTTCQTECKGGDKYWTSWTCQNGAWVGTLGLVPCADGGAGTGGSGPDSGQGGGGASTGGGSGTGGSTDGGADGGPRDGAVSYSCTKNSDCVLVDRTCCGACGEPTIADKVSVNVDSAPAWRAFACANPVPCTPCSRAQGTLQAVCKAGVCDIQNLAQYKECLKSSDCIVHPVDCCPCGGLTAESGVLAENVSGQFPACVASCPACPGGVHLPNVGAACYLAGGYCVLQ